MGGDSSGDAASQLAARVRADIQNNRIDTLRLPAGTMRHLVREAAAVGALLRDAEARVQSFGLLQQPSVK
jgi:hypothetical protein